MSMLARYDGTSILWFHERGVPIPQEILGDMCLFVDDEIFAKVPFQSSPIIDLLHFNRFRSLPA